MLKAAAADNVATAAQKGRACGTALSLPTDELGSRLNHDVLSIMRSLPKEFSGGRHAYVYDTLQCCRPRVSRASRSQPIHPGISTPLYEMPPSLIQISFLNTTLQKFFLDRAQRGLCG